MAVRRAFRRGGRGWKPGTFWDGSVPAVQTAVPAASKVLLLSFTNAGDSELTIRRMRGLLTVGSDQIAGSELQLGAFGALITTDTAIAAGVASLPDPVTDVSDDIWMMYEHFGDNMQVFTAVGIEPHFVSQYVIDSKAMRRVPEGRALAFVVANSHATHGINVSFGVRFLSSLTGT